MIAYYFFNDCQLMQHFTMSSHVTTVTLSHRVESISINVVQFLYFVNTGIFNISGKTVSASNVLL